VYFANAADEEKLLRLSERQALADGGKCVISSGQVFSAGDTFRYGRHTW